MKKVIRALLFLTGIALILWLGKWAYETAFGASLHAAPKRSLTEHWQDVKDTLGHETARDLDSPEIIAERQKTLMESFTDD